MGLWVMLYLPSFQADCGDYVVVTNAKKVKVSGRKEDQVLYRKHTMYPGGLKEVRYKEMMKRKPDEVRCAHYRWEGGHSHSFCFVFRPTDYSPSGIWNVAQKQAAGEAIREAPYFSRRGYGHIPTQYCEAMGRRDADTYPQQSP